MNGLTLLLEDLGLRVSQAVSFSGQTVSWTYLPLPPERQSQDLDPDPEVYERFMRPIPVIEELLGRVPARRG